MPALTADEGGTATYADCNLSLLIVAPGGRQYVSTAGGPSGIYKHIIVGCLELLYYMESELCHIDLCILESIITITCLVFA